MSVAPSNAVVEALLGAIRGLGYERLSVAIQTLQAFGFKEGA
jgi:hypothetical protein